ncbi:MAG TPA: CDP-alcohol phosphatidyltransferase family protein [Nocardioidaceae bacterium]|nr:CDP-alcohol phosphatidyltransferase family protein [Nocardioidaceae bacterium]
MTSGDGGTACTHRECAHGERERLLTGPNVVTFVRTAATVVLALLGARQGSLGLLEWALAVYWVGDIADGALARATGQETRTGATLDIMCDRLSAALFYVGFAWYEPRMVVPVGLYLVEFLVIDMFLSLAFLAWPISSPNYFHLVDRRIWRWNWSKPGKAVNSALLAVLMVVTRDLWFGPWLAGAIAAALLVLKVTSLFWLLRLRIPVPSGCGHEIGRSPTPAGRTKDNAA